MSPFPLDATHLTTLEWPDKPDMATLNEERCDAGMKTNKYLDKCGSLLIHYVLLYEYSVVHR